MELHRLGSSSVYEKVEEEFFKSKGYTKHLTKGSGTEMFEQWRKYEDVPSQTITESDYEVNPRKGLSFDEYAKKWKVAINETISPWDPNLTPLEKKKKALALEMENDAWEEVDKDNEVKKKPVKVENPGGR